MTVAGPAWENGRAYTAVLEDAAVGAADAAVGHPLSYGSGFRVDAADFIAAGAAGQVAMDFMLQGAHIGF